MFYSVIEAKTLRTAKANNNANSFYSSVKSLIFRRTKQNAHNDKLLNIFYKTSDLLPI